MFLRSTIAEEGDNGGGFVFLQRKNRKNRLNIPGRFAGGVDGGDDGVDGADEVGDGVEDVPRRGVGRDL